MFTENIEYIRFNRLTIGMFMGLRRSLSTTQCWMLRGIPKKANRGVNHQLAELEDAAEIIQNDPEGFGDLESNLFDAHNAHKDYEKYLKNQNEKIRRFVVKRKYFHTDPLPNLLTYAEKEHIRLLHNRSPDDWTFERLAESFPASPNIIKKIIKANWRPLSSERVAKHDSMVLENWQAFKNGAFDNQLPFELKEHLNKFSTRKPYNINNVMTSKEYFESIKLPQPKTHEFRDLISCSSIRRIQQSISSNTSNVNKQIDETRFPSNKSFNSLMNYSEVNDENETHLISKIKNKKHIRLQDLKKSILKSSINNDNSKILHETDKSSNINCNSFIDIKEKYESNVSITQNDLFQLKMPIIKYRVHIPRKLWRKGTTYRIEDCYYDDDGEFLYRVPGIYMNQNKKT